MDARSASRTCPQCKGRAPKRPLNSFSSMMHRSISLVAAALTVAACVKRTAPSGSSAMLQSGKPIVWSGSFQQQQQVASGVGPTSKNRAFGSVKLAPSSSNPSRTRVEIELTAPVQAAASMAWGVYPGRCGSGSGLGMPIVATSSLPMLEATRNGSASLASDVAMELPVSGTYHLNVFWGISTGDLADVLTCANLKQSSER